MLKNQQNYTLWNLLNNECIIRIYENEYENSKTAFTMTIFTDMLHHHISKSTLSGKSLGLPGRNFQKSFIDALVIATAESEGVKINKKLYEGDMLVDVQRHLACEHDNCLSSKSRNVVLTDRQVSRNSDALSLRRGEMIRVMKLLKTRVGSANLVARLRYEDMILRTQTGSGLTK